MYQFIEKRIYVKNFLITILLIIWGTTAIIAQRRVQQVDTSWNRQTERVYRNTQEQPSRVQRDTSWNRQAERVYRNTQEQPSRVQRAQQVDTSWNRQTVRGGYPTREEQQAERQVQQAERDKQLQEQRAIREAQRAEQQRQFQAQQAEREKQLQIQKAEQAEREKQRAEQLKQIQIKREKEQRLTQIVLGIIGVILFVIFLRLPKEKQQVIVKAIGVFAVFFLRLCITVISLGIIGGFRTWSRDR